MTILLKKIFLVLLPALALVVTFEILARTIPTSYGTKRSYLIGKKEHIEVLVLGSSHANFGINPSYFGRPAFNIANGSQSLYQDRNMLLQSLDECRKVKMVIVPVSYFTLQSDLASSPEAWRCAFYSFYCGVRGEASQSPFDIRNHSALALWDGPIGVVKGLRNQHRLDINQFGYQAPDKSNKSVDEIINDDTGMARVKYHEKFMNHDLLSSNIRILDDIATTLKQRNIVIVLVTIPVYKTYYRHISKKNYDIMVNSLEVLSKKHGIKYFNYFYDDRFNVGDFMDNDHFNEEGARKFSLILKHDIVDRLIPDNLRP